MEGGSEEETKKEERQPRCIWNKNHTMLILDYEESPVLESKKEVESSSSDHTPRYVRWNKDHTKLILNDEETPRSTKKIDHTEIILNN
jgi:hypothetical protein